MVLNPIMACQDKQLRVLGEDGKNMLYIHQFEAACVSISIAPDLSERSSPIIGYGLNNGEIGVIELMRNKPAVLWSVHPNQIESCSPVSIVKTCRLNKQSAA